MRVFTIIVLLGAFAAAATSAQVADFEADDAAWAFGRGSEYPGAQGSFERTTDAAHGGAAAGRITGDFSGGGRYVHLTRAFATPVDAAEVSLWARAADVTYLLVRLEDESGQTHQHRLPLQPGGDWQRPTLRKLASGQHWGGANDGQWHGRVRSLGILLEKQAITAESPRATVLIDDVAVTGGAAADSPAPPPAPKDAATTAGDHSGFEAGDQGWSFGLGSEYKGAKGSMQRTAEAAHEGAHSMRLAADFSEGGRYVQLTRELKPPLDVRALSLWVRPHRVNKILIRVADSTGQTFQHHVHVEPNDNWQQIRLDNFRSREKWGGANDGQWHPPLTRVSILLEKTGIVDGGTEAHLYVDDIRLGDDAEAPARQSLRLPVPLGTFDAHTAGWWELSDAGASTKLSIDPSAGHARAGALKAVMDLSAGGNWANLIRQLDQPFDIAALRFHVKADNVRALNVSILTASGQDVSRQVPLEDGGQWQLVELRDLPRGAGAAVKRDKLYGATVAIRVGVAPETLIDRARPATLWLDDAEAVAVGSGVLYTPGAALRAGDGMVGRIDLPSALPIYWGPDQRPRHVAVRFDNQSPQPMPVPGVKLLDHRLKEIATLLEARQTIAPGATFTRELPLELPAFGHYTIATAIDGKPLRARLAWIAAEGQPDPDGPFGIHHHLSQGPWGRGQYIGDGPAVIELTRRIGAGWIREDIRGQFDADDTLLSTPRGGYFDWADSAKARGLSIIATYFDFLQNGKPPTDDIHRQRYAKRFAQLVERYKDAIDVFEVWNEPNIEPGWRGRPNPEDYAKLLAAAYPAIKQAHGSATVVGVTSAGTDFAYIDRVLQAGGARWMDAISVHPYHGVAPELRSDRKEPNPIALGEGDTYTFVERIEIISRLLEKHGAAGMPIWATEMGSGNKTDDTEWLDTCRLIRQYLLGMSLPQLTRQFAYNFQDQGYNEDEASHMTFGLLRSDGSPEPRLVAYNTMARTLHRKRFSGQVDLGEGIYAYQFAGPGGEALAIWSVDEGRTAAFATDAASVRVIDLMGNERQVSAVGGRITLAATGEPLFILDAGAVRPAPPLLTLSAPAKATGEDQISVTVDRHGLPPAAPLAGDAGAGWQVRSATSDRVVFAADSSLRTGLHVFVVESAGMSAATSVRIDNAISLSVAPAGEGRIRITANNPFPRPRRIELRPTAPGRSIEPVHFVAPAGGEADIELAVETRTDAGQTTVPVVLNPSLPAGEVGYIDLGERSDRVIAGATPWHTLSPSIDGRLDEWQALPPCLLDQAHQAQAVGRFARPAWGGEADLSGRFRVASDDDGVYLAVEVRDDRHVQDFPDDQMWKGDCVQVAMLLDGQRHEFTIAAGDDGRVRVRQDSPHKRMLDAPAAARRDGDTWQIELALPWRAMGLAAGPRVPQSFALLINDNDGRDASAQAGRKGYLEWFGGIGGERKDPSLYGPVIPAQASASAEAR